jgi:hypothetical protein
MTCTKCDPVRSLTVKPHPPKGVTVRVEFCCHDHSPVPWLEFSFTEAEVFAADVLKNAKMAREAS